MKADNHEIKIEKGIPVPPRARPSKFPWAKMRIGDSFVCQVKTRQTVGAASKRLSMKFVTRKINETQIRIWRIK